MLRIFVIFAFFAAVYGSGELTVLWAPDSVEFKRSETTIACSAIESVITAPLGMSITKSSNFKSLIINNPFDLPQYCVFHSMQGGNKMSYGDMKTTSYTVTGTDCGHPAVSAMQRFQEDHSSVVDVDLSTGLSALEHNVDSLGEIKVNVDDFKCPLSMSNLDERKMCEQFAAMAAIRESFKTRMDAPALLRIHVSFVSLLGNSKLYNDAVDFYRIEMNNMLTTMKERFGESKVMALSYVTKEDPSSVEHRRLRRATDTKEDPDLNLARVYDDNYPVIFNIILWFGVVLVFSLYAIGYAIATMDPGRDSIIYRMTSTRIKKDN